MKRSFLSWGFFFGFSGIILGAMATHALEGILNSDQMSSFQTGVRYQIYHALLLLILAQFNHLQSKLLLTLLIIGTISFSFSIYLLNLRTYLEMDSLQWLGPVTPIGGSLLIISWALLLIKALQGKS